MKSEEINAFITVILSHWQPPVSTLHYRLKLSDGWCRVEADWLSSQLQPLKKCARQLLDRIWQFYLLQLLSPRRHWALFVVRLSSYFASSLGLSLQQSLSNILVKAMTMTMTKVTEHIKITNRQVLLPSSCSYIPLVSFPLYSITFLKLLPHWFKAYEMIDIFLQVVNNATPTPTPENCVGRIRFIESPLNTF